MHWSSLCQCHIDCLHVCALHPRVRVQLFKIQVILSLYQGQGANRFCALSSSICGHQGANFVFLVCALLEARVFSRFSSFSHQICVGPRSRHQSIFGTPQFQLRPLGGQHHLFLVWTVTTEFSADLFKLALYIPQTKAYTSISFQCSAVHFRPLGREVRFQISPPVNTTRLLRLGSLCPHVWILWVKV